MAQDELDAYINSLITRKNLGDLAPDERSHIAGELKAQLVEQINRAVLDALPDDKLDELDALSEREGFTAEDMQKFIIDSGVDMAKITTEAVHNFETQYIGEGTNRA